MTRQMLLALGLSFSLLTPVVAQEPAKQGEVVRVTTNLVQIDVVVTDKDGRTVTDLSPDDFEVSEDGKKQQITNFSYISAVDSAVPRPDTAASTSPSKKPAEPVMPAQLKREEVRRTVALVIDDLGLSFESFGYARKALSKFVDEQMQPNDLVAVLRTSKGVGVLQQFTSDKRQLHAAIESLRWNSLGRGGISPVGTLNEQSTGADIRSNIQYIEEAEETRAGQYSVGTIGTMNAIVRGLGEMPGRKSIVLVSEAFRLFSVQGRNVQLLNSLRQLTDEANANSVTIYTVDASGLQSYTLEASDRVSGYSYVIDPELLAASGGPGLGGGAGGVAAASPPRTLQRADSLSAQAEQDSGAAFRRLAALSAMREQQSHENHTVLSYLARRTGGLFERNRNDLAAGIERIMQDQQGYYLIGYRPNESTIALEGRRKLRNLNVKVKRSGFKVRSRGSYAGLSDEDKRIRPRTREQQLTAALISPFASTGVRVRLTSLFGDEPNSGGTYLRSLLHIDARDLTFKEEAGGVRTAELEMVAVAFGDSGQIVDQLSYPQTVRAANEAEYQRMVADGLVYILNFPIKRGGPYQMRVAVRDAASERNGAAMQFVEVPDLTKNRMALSGIVLSNGAESDKTTAADQDIQSGPAVRRFRPGMMLDYRYIIFNAAESGTSTTALVQTQMRLLREGQPAFTGKVVPLDVAKQPSSKRISLGGRLRIGPELIPGDYVLQVVVTNTTDPKKPRLMTQWIDFEIVK
jgi:VWFA-related protein